ncbi:hypothetical protein [Streptomyces goshikiensis]|uniref:hypothetical protein n=1 Tax=Streptomyces goshikiensis TaxID=1942 RepID=UPI0036D00C0B
MTETRHTVDTITPEALAQLYAELDQTRRDRSAVELGSHETINYWRDKAIEARQYSYRRDLAHASTILQARRQATRAKQAEASVGRLYQQVLDAKEQARKATVAALNLQAQTPNAAQATLNRIRKADSWLGIWTALGMYYGLTSTEAGTTARDRRENSVIPYLAEAEHRVRQAEQRAAKAEEAAANRDGHASKILNITADSLERSCPDHSTSGGCFMTCQCAAAHEVRRLASDLTVIEAKR